MPFCSGMKSIGAVCLALLFTGICLGDDVPPPPEPYKPMPGEAPPRPSQPPASANVDVPLEVILKNALARNLPPELVIEENRDWGHQAHVPSIQGVKVIEVLRNHGDWDKMTVICHDVPHHLSLFVHEVRLPSPDRLSLAIHLSLAGEAEIKKRIYQNGVQVFGEHGRARFRLTSVLTVEAGLKLEWKGKAAPDNALSFKVVDVKTSIHDFQAESVNGLGGEVAKASGGILHVIFKHMQPALERDLCIKMREAMLKTGASREVGVNLAELIRFASYQAVLGPPLPFQTAQLEGTPIGRPFMLPAPAETEPFAFGGLVVNLNFWNRVRSPERAAQMNSTIHATAPTSITTTIHSGGSESGYSGLSSHSEHSEHSGHSEGGGSSSSHSESHKK